MTNGKAKTDYVQLLEAAGDDAEGEADENLIEERLKALGLETGEAEQLAAVLKTV